MKNKIELSPIPLTNTDKIRIREAQARERVSWERGGQATDRKRDPGVQAEREGENPVDFDRSVSRT
jgi:hypothetical protein